MQKRPLNVAIVGYGLAGSVFHAPLIASTRGMSVAAIVTANPGRRQRAGRDFPEARVLDTADEIWNDAAHVDLVVVASPNRYHAPLALAAIRHGIAVVIDKPMALSTGEALDLIRMSRESSVPVTCFQNRRWDGDFLTVRRLVANGMLGPITRFESRFERYRPTVRPDAWREHTAFEAGGGLLWDLGSHLIDQAILLFGPPDSVYAEMASRRSGATVDDDTFVALHFADDVVAHLWMSVTARVPGPRMVVRGLSGAYEKYGLDPQEETLRVGERPGDDTWGKEHQTSWGHLRASLGGVNFDGNVETLPGDYPAFYQQVRDALIEGTPMPVDPDDAARTIGVIEAARRSAVSGTVERLLSADPPLPP
ncbi:MAG TPA: Gfo/Idh/MocA family oxidoreductase [Chloroflexota bacterium]|nr:Gfo/Idh/MocA family oxidoreductase [Chloroflexota bacterium]